MEITEVFFSVIIPVYNLENYIGRALQSVLESSYGDFEIIVVDDGSTDNSVAMIEKYCDLDQRIKLFKKQNGGVSSARNFGILKSKGKYVYFFDGDDMIDSNLLGRAYEIIDNNNVDLFAFGYESLNSNLKTLRSYQAKRYDGSIFSGKEFLENYLYKKIPQHVCSAIVRKDIIDFNNLNFDISTKQAEDIEYMVKMMNCCKNVYYTSNIYFFYINREGSAMNQPIRKENFDVYNRIDEYLIPISRNAAYQNRCYWFVNFYRKIILKGSDKKTVLGFLRFEYVLQFYHFKWDRFSIITGIFRIFYKPFFRKYLIHKYSLEDAS